MMYRIACSYRISLDENAVKEGTSLFVYRTEAALPIRRKASNKRDTWLHAV